MPRLKFQKQQDSDLAELVARYIETQRAEFSEQARPIRSSEQEVLGMFFPTDVLSVVRVVRGHGKEPSFYPQVRAMGIRNLPAFSGIAGITFRDVIVHVEALSRQLLFYELVHAVQYKHLGLRGFAERYVLGFLTGGSYEDIPLEKEAYELEARFAQNPTSPFSVEADAKEQIRMNAL